MKTGKTGSSSSAGLEGPVYFDASALVKLYLPEPESVVVEELVAGRRDVLVSRLAVTEVVSALARRAREKSITAEGASLAHGALLDDLAAGRFLLARLGDDAHRGAERLLLLSEVPMRCADALHLAMALGERARTMLTFDRVLSSCALSAGLVVAPRVSSP